MKPTENQNCEICKKENLSILYDARVKAGFDWPKGHFVFMCVECHLIYGLSTKQEDLIVYERFNGRFFEVTYERTLE